MRKPGRNRSTAEAQEGAGSRQAILEAALKAFARGGFDGASLPKIAAIAEVAPPLIHYYFNSKENLWRETVDYSLGELRRESSGLLKATQSLAPLDRLRALFEAITRFAAHWPDHFVMIVAEARSESDRFGWLQSHYTGPLFEEILTILVAAKDAGAIRDVDIEQLAFMLIGGVLLYFTVKPDVFAGRDIDRVAADFTDLMFRMFLDGVAQR